MISHPCLICERNPAVSADNGSDPIRAQERGSGCAAKRSAGCCTRKKPKPSGGAGTGATPSPTESISGRPKPSRLRLLRVPAPLAQLPWEFAKDEFGSQYADFMGYMGSLMVRTAKD
jgi:hypothetical protein